MISIISKTTKVLLLCVAYFVSTSLVAGDKYAGFPAPQADFSAHINEVKNYLLATQMSQRKTEDVRFNLPFELLASTSVTYRGKFLLFHGLNDSPYVLTDVAAALSIRGFDVRAILLPGHGNSPEAQLNMSYTQWITAAREQLQYWDDQDSSPMYLGGFSLGGVLATALAIEHGKIEGLLLFSPAYKSNMNHLLRWSSMYAKFKPWVFGGMIIEDNPTKYNSIPINGAAQYYETTQYLKRRWKQRPLEMPVLVVASRDDSVLDIDFLINVFKRKFKSIKKRLLLYDNASGLTDSDFMQFRSSAYPKLRILNQSHQSVLMSSKNPLFGEKGAILVCNGNDWPTFSACLYSKRDHWFGAQHTPSPDGVPVARSTYNPDFDNVFSVFDEVFGGQ
ncbi:MAG: esterase/lipase [bacterium]|jgi:alpha-beta hydrolase superfamily lysophospholipase